MPISPPAVCRSPSLLHPRARVMFEMKMNVFRIAINTPGRSDRVARLRAVARRLPRLPSGPSERTGDRRTFIITQAGVAGPSFDLSTAPPSACGTRVKRVRSFSVSLTGHLAANCTRNSRVSPLPPWIRGSTTKLCPQDKTIDAGNSVVESPRHTSVHVTLPLFAIRPFLRFASGGNAIFPNFRNEALPKRPVTNLSGSLSIVEHAISAAPPPSYPTLVPSSSPTTSPPPSSPARVAVVSFFRYYSRSILPRRSRDVVLLIYVNGLLPVCGLAHDGKRARA